MDKRFGFLMVLIFGLFLAGCTSKNSNPTPAPLTLPEIPSGAFATSSNPSASFYKMTEVSQHNQANNCWMVISGRVYNFTAYVGVHPGGMTMAANCGTDGTAAFNQVSKHAGKTQNILPNYWIGQLAN
jgi:hypothetical protein